MSDLHAAIMNLQCEPDTSNHGERLAFKRGHKQARHAAAELIDAADIELDAMARDAARWRYYAGRVAAMMGLSIEEMAREIDEAIETARAEAASSGSSLKPQN